MLAEALGDVAGLVAEEGEDGGLEAEGVFSREVFEIELGDGEFGDDFGDGVAGGIGIEIEGEGFEGYGVGRRVAIEGLEEGDLVGGDDFEVASAEGIEALAGLDLDVLALDLDGDGVEAAVEGGDLGEKAISQ